MKASNMPRFGLAAALCAAIFAVSAAMGQDASETKKPAPDAPKANAASAAKSSSGGEPASTKAQTGDKTAKVSDADKKPKPGQYATEAEARSHCRGTIVWIDEHQFNHYAGSREYGRKPGGFACEN